MVENKLLAIILVFLGAVGQTQTGVAVHSMPHEMQHGFVLSADDKFASHLVATGHHSRQAEITGQLVISDKIENEFYAKRKFINENSYFLFQAQSLDLSTLKAGQVLTGHIVESQLGKYESKNIIVKEATFTVDQVMLNIENPFFGDQ